jgi:NAD+ synthase
MPLSEIVARGHPAETVNKIETMLYLAEYKRRQAPPGVKISSKNFGRDRRYPIVNKFREKVVGQPVAKVEVVPAPDMPKAKRGERA